MDKPVDPKHVEKVAKGDYVLATKYDDGDPGDHWCIGWYDAPIPSGDRHLILDSEGNQFRHNGFRRVGHIEPTYAEWLLSIAAELEASPPGSVNLWGMMGVTATPETENG